VIVGTLASLRVTDTAGRKIYAHNENLEAHFSSLKLGSDLERFEEGPGKGQVKLSFANLLRHHRPLVLMDEAHNARTRLTFESLGRISPACIVEFTATPDRDARTGSNILFRVSAAELKAEEMIKLPIMLVEHRDWQAAVTAALATRKALAAAAVGESRLVRPIALFQAESKDKPVTVEVLREHLVANEKVSPDAIAVATGDQRDLDGVNLFDPKCPIEVIITVQALKEGWDCSFAYVFCSVANIHSAVDVEQLLGRVLRMPYAQRRAADSLNRAYAHVSSASFAEAAGDLRDRLVSMGFEEEEADQSVEQGSLFEGASSSAPALSPLVLSVAAAPDLSALPSALQAAVTVRRGAGGVEVEVAGEVSPELERSLLAAVPEDQRGRARSAIAIHRQQLAVRASPASRGETIEVPRLFVRIQGELELVDSSLFLEAGKWDLLAHPAELPEMRTEVESKTFVFDVEGGHVVWSLSDAREQLRLEAVKTEWNANELARWLDRQVRQPDVPQATMLEFVRRVVEGILESRKSDLGSLVGAKYLLAKALVERIGRYRVDALSKGFQRLLFAPDAAPEVPRADAFNFSPACYPAKSWYRGHYRFTKHFYATPGELESAGEEFDCAVALDAHPQVKTWVRNLALQPMSSFWLPTSTDRFYPDFVAVLKDGRRLVVEYKGAHLLTAEDTKEKRSVGELWEAKSGGAGLFLIATKSDAEGRDVLNQLTKKIGPA
jgi:type III restriction enzyme